MKLNFKLVGLALSATLLVASCGKQNDEDILPPSPPEQQYGGNDSLIGTWYDIRRFDTNGVLSPKGIEVVFTDSTMHGVYCSQKNGEREDILLYDHILYVVSNDTIKLPSAELFDSSIFATKFTFSSNDTLWLEHFELSLPGELYIDEFLPITLVRSREVENEE